MTADRRLYSFVYLRLFICNYLDTHFWYLHNNTIKSESKGDKAMKKSVKWVAAAAAVMLTLSASVGVTSSADEGTTVKAGFIFLHDENSTYDLNFINAAKEACEKMGIEYVFKTGIPRAQKHMTAACELADARLQLRICRQLRP